MLIYYWNLNKLHSTYIQEEMLLLGASPIVREAQKFTAKYPKMADEVSTKSAKKISAI